MVTFKNKFAGDIPDYLQEAYLLPMRSGKTGIEDMGGARDNLQEALDAFIKAAGALALRIDNAEVWCSCPHRGGAEMLEYLADTIEDFPQHVLRRLDAELDKRDSRDA